MKNIIMYIRLALLLTAAVSVSNAAFFSFPPGAEQSEANILLEVDFTISITAVNGTEEIASFSEGSAQKDDITMIGAQGQRSFLQLRFPNSVSWSLIFDEDSKNDVSLDRIVQFVPSAIFPQFPEMSDLLMFNDQGMTDLHSSSKSYSCGSKVETTYNPNTARQGGIQFKVSATVSGLKVQAYNVKDGKFSPSVECSSSDIVTPTTLAPTTTTSTTTTTTEVPHISGVHMLAFTADTKVGNDSIPCISIEGRFSLEIDYQASYSRYATERKTIKTGIPDSATAHGQCQLSTGTQSIIVSFFNGWTIELLFSINYAFSRPYEDGDSQSKMDYAIEKVALKYNTNNALFPQAYTSDGSDFSVSVSKKDDLPRKRATGGFFLCNTERRLRLNKDVTLVMSDVRFKAFISDQDTNFYGMPDQCEDDKASLAPNPLVVVLGCLVVSVSILVFIAVVMILGIKCQPRRRRRRQYRPI